MERAKRDSNMLVTGLVIGVLQFGAFAAIYAKLPKRVKRWTVRHPLFSDALFSIICFALVSSISQSILAVVAGLTCAIMVSTWLWIQGKKLEGVELARKSVAQRNRREASTKDYEWEAGC
jgi:hypothetical protein